MKKKISLLLALALSLAACSGPKADPTPTPDSQTTEPTVESQVPIKSELLTCIGKPLSALKDEFPAGEVFDRPDGLPDAALICFGEKGSDTSYVFFGTQGVDYLPCMEQYPEQVNCCGVVAPVSALFPMTLEVMTLADFFEEIGISEYHYEEEADVALGWVTFSCGKYTVFINANQRKGEDWTYTGAREIRGNAPAVVMDTEIEAANVRFFEEHFGAGQ